ncbi:hypothetical protein KEM48_003581 [Puccinia striiformis f. sp. tritici PST-130]|nr:hypothetical protein KEM48_003581 [Puccinia striiformis f. sp. tritici PST-130]
MEISDSHNLRDARYQGRLHSWNRRTIEEDRTHGPRNDNDQTRLQDHCVCHQSNNATDVLKIWTSIINEFASNDEANRRRIWSELSYLTLSETDIPGFIVKVKSILVKMNEVGIVVDSDIVGFEIVKKFPNTTEMTVIKTTLDHSGVPVTPYLVLKHLKQHADNIASSAPIVQSSQVALFTDASRLCKPKTHNTLANHPEEKYVLTVRDEDTRSNSPLTVDPVEEDDYETAIEDSSDSGNNESSDSESNSTIEEESEVASALVPEPRYSEIVHLRLNQPSTAILLAIQFHLEPL